MLRAPVPSRWRAGVRWHDAGGGHTYAAHYDLNGVTYFNNAPEGVLNTYTIAAS